MREWKNRIIVNVNNYCNMRCYSCAALCHTPMGSNTFRDKPRDTLPSQFDLFLNRIKSYRVDAWIRFVGGEPTASPYIEELAEVARKWGRKISVFTNGYRLTEYDPFIFDHIHFDNHEINMETIKQCTDYLDSKGFENYHVSNVFKHRDLSVRMSCPPQGTCNMKEQIKLLTLWQEVIYPCCSMYYVEGWLNTTKGTELLTDAGWHINNPDLATVLTNWKQEFPKEAYNAVCKPGCWALRSKNGSWVNLMEWERRLKG